MSPAARSEVAAAVADAHRREWAFVLAATVRVAGDLDSAEEAVQDAYASALATWGARGIPENPGAWLTTAARRRALDVRRRAATAQRALPKLLEPAPDDEFDRIEIDVPDDRLRLIFTCCHPALPVEAQVALTLRLVCGLTTPDVARAFLVPEPTMAARITRAKRKIAKAHIPYQVPSAAQLPARVHAVLEVVHLVFTTGHTAPSGMSLLRRDLTERAHDLARMLHQLLPADREVAALLSLILLTDARRDARVDSAGSLVLLADQDRSRWDQIAIGEGIRLLRQALTHRSPSRFALMAAIAAVHDEARTWEDTDWPEIQGLYDLLLETWPSPVVAMNRAIATGFAIGPADGLAELDRLALEPMLARYGYLAAARADFLKRLGRNTEAIDAYEEAVLLTENDAEREFLIGALDRLKAPGLS
jgi:RNA polymerase sigma factor (sigma-70 family)